MMRPNYRDRKKIDLVGEASETVIYIDEVETRCLIDSGSTVSTVSEAFYTDHLRHLTIHPLSTLLQIECADGQNLPYFGYVEVAMTTPGVNITEPIDIPLLVVPNSNYNSRVPVLLGTNVIQHIMDRLRTRHGERYLQEAALHTPWYLTFRSMSLIEKELAKNNNRIGLVKSAALKPVTIPPNSAIKVLGYVDKAVPYHNTLSIVQATNNFVIPSDLEIVPSVFNFEYPCKDVIDINIENITTRTVQIQPRAIICEIQPVTIEDERLMSSNNDDVKEPLNLVKIGDDISDQQRQLCMSLLEKYRDVFSTSDTDIGHTTLVRHKIELDDDRPFKQRTRHIPPGMYAEVRQHIKQLLDGGIIQKSKSPWASNVVLCRKKSGELRMCVDFRQLNLRTKKDSYALPRTEEILEALAGNRYFTILDMKSGYHHIELHEPHKERTAFTVGPLGFYEFHRMPFGLVNAPATYQRLMEQCFEGLHLDICYIYLDDLIIFSKTFEEHITRLEKIFQRLRDVNLKLSPKKCEFFKRKVKYVGNIVSEEGIEPDPDKILKVINWPVPTTPEDVRRFLGFVGYYRRFIEGFSAIAHPLNILLPDTKKKARKGAKSKKSTEGWIWGREQQDSFDRLKEKLTTYPILGFPDYQKPFELHTDASMSSIGAVLYQQQGDVKRVIAYASRSLSKSEQKYPVHKLEFLALKWSVCEKFHDYLLGCTFKAVTDNNPLTYVLTSAKLDATSQRWIAALANYDFTINYRPGSKLADADGMSRIPPDNSATITSETIKAICNVHYSPPLVESVACDPSNVSDNLPALHDFTEVDIAQEQRSDPVLRFWLPYVKRQLRPDKRYLPLHQPAVHAAFLKNFDRLTIIDDVMCRSVTVNGQLKYQIVLPKSCVTTVLQHLHYEMGHPGRDRTIGLIRDRFYWYGMTGDVERYINNCRRCLLRKSPMNERAPLISIQTYQPLELVCTDYLKLETSKGGFQYLLVITDHFTRFAQAIPTKNQTAKTTADALFNHFIVHYGVPSKLHSDQGAQFESTIIQELCKILNIRKSRTTPYHPMGNGLCERFNRQLLQMLGTLNNHQKQDWKSHIAPLVHAYNSCKQETTGHSPFYLMFGREPVLPVDIMFPNPHQPNQKENLQEHIQHLKDRLQQSYKLAQESIQKHQGRQKRNYDVRARGAVIEPGDKVLVKILAFDGTHKISDRWEEKPYVVERQPDKSIPVYVVSNGEKTRTLHRNLLLPISHLDDRDVDPPPDKPVPAPRRMRTRSRPKTPVSHGDSYHYESDEDSVDLVEIREADTIAHSNDSAPASIPDDEHETPSEASHIRNEGDQHVEDVQDEASSQTPDTPDDNSDHSAEGDTEVENSVREPEADMTTHDQGDTGDDTQEGAVGTQELRRSVRTKKPPAWMNEDFIISQQIARDIPDWKKRVDTLKTLLSENELMGIDRSEVSKTFLKLITMEKE